MGANSFLLEQTLMFLEQTILEQTLWEQIISF